MSSLKPGAEILGQPWSPPTQLHWANFSRAWNEAGIGTAFVNSALVTLASLALLIPIGAMAAYVLAKYAFRGSTVLSMGFLGGMMFPHLLVVVPLFLMLRDLRLLDTLHGLVIVYVAYSLSFTVFVLSGFFRTLPDELGEAAMLDGCGHAATFWRIMLPLARPGILVVAIFNAIGLWNEYALALVLLPSARNATLPLGIANLTVTQQYQSDWGALFAGLVIVMLPVLAVYAVFRDRIYDTMLAGAVKG
jgi:N-acetylglucosamine transport system permease protein